MAWRESGARLTVVEAAARGPAVEMATRARLALGEEVEVEQGEPVKRSGGGGEGAGGVFVNVRAAQASFVQLTEWCAKVEAQAVFTLDGTRTLVGGSGARGGGGQRETAEGAEHHECVICRLAEHGLEWVRCVNCERMAHRRCCYAEDPEYCMECAGADGEEVSQGDRQYTVLSCVGIGDHHIGVVRLFEVV